MVLASSAAHGGGLWLASWHSYARLRLATAGWCATAARVIHSTAVWMLDSVAVPEQSKARTATRWTLLATPNWVPPTAPAAWVRCLLMWWATASLSTKSQPLLARPPKSLWDTRTPVSRTYTVTGD